MIVLNTNTPQTLKVIPRIYESAFQVAYTDDSTNVRTEVSISGASTSGNYLTWSQSFNPLLVVNHFYDLELFSNYAFWNQNFSLWQNYTRLWNDASDFINVFYKDRIFCTNETIDQKVDKYYDMNKGQFITTTAYNNEYIVTS
jgi:hypothetical protein|tara:strand:- start:660 stop:1088 length:429 start_codon:yes stop_codon:yes gene_type:complete